MSTYKLTDNNSQTTFVVDMEVFAVFTNASFHKRILTSSVKIDRDQGQASFNSKVSLNPNILIYCTTVRIPKCFNGGMVRFY